MYCLNILEIDTESINLYWFTFGLLFIANIIYQYIKVQKKLKSKKEKQEETKID